MSMIVLAGGQSLTMSSLEIAEMVNSRHDKVKQSIERLADRGVIVRPPMVDEHSEDAMGRTRVTQVYVFSGARGKRDSIIAVAQLSPEFTARLVDRWQELEEQQSQQAPKIPATYAEALRLAAEQAEQIERQQQALAIAAPKVAFVDSYVDATGLKGFRQVARLIRANEAQFRVFLIERKIMYRLAGEWVAYQNHIDAGRFAVRTGEANGHAFTRSMFTPKGVEWVAGEFAKFNLKPSINDAETV